MAWSFPTKVVEPERPRTIPQIKLWAKTQNEFRALRLVILLNLLLFVSMIYGMASHSEYTRELLIACTTVVGSTVAGMISFVRGKHSDD
jgi:hypothetical protein